MNSGDGEEIWRQALLRLSTYPEKQKKYSQSFITNLKCDKIMLLNGYKKMFHQSFKTQKLK
jgi:hypothetical protein